MRFLKIIVYIIIITTVSFYIWNPTFKNVRSHLSENIPKHLVPNDLNAVDLTFGVSVYTINELGKILGLSYNEINIWIFVVIMPLLILFLLLHSIFLHIKIKKLMF